MEAENSLKSIVYITVNTVNNKIYVGVHITNTPYKFDNYYGCGINGTSSYWFKHPKYPFLKACKKYGLNAFKRYTLYVFDTYEEALEKEKEIVNEEFIKRPDTYNVALGGGSGLVPSTEVEVFQYNLNGDFITSYRSKQEAARQNNTTFLNIHYAIITRSEFNKSFWTVHKVANLITSEYNPRKDTNIYIYNSDGSYKETLPSVSYFARKYDKTLGVALRALANQTKCNNFYLSKEKLDKFIPNTKKRIRHKVIYQYSLDGKFIKALTFLEAKDLLGINYKKLSAAISSGYRCGGYLWSYKELPSIEIKKQKIKIALYDLLDNLVKVWDSYRACEKEFSNLRYVLNGIRTNTKGFKFKRLEN